MKEEERNVEKMTSGTLSHCCFQTCNVENFTPINWPLSTCKINCTLSITHSDWSWVLLINVAYYF